MKVSFSIIKDFRSAGGTTSGRSPHAWKFPCRIGGQDLMVEIGTTRNSPEHTGTPHFACKELPQKGGQRSEVPSHKSRQGARLKDFRSGGGTASGRSPHSWKFQCRISGQELMVEIGTTRNSPEHAGTLYSVCKELPQKGGHRSEVRRHKSQQGTRRHSEACTSPCSVAI